MQNHLIPLDEHHVRMWLREIYPSQFSPAVDLNADDNASLELEEIRSVFRALLSKHIEPLWFTGRIFNASVHESFGLVLRNQRDRFLLSYYEHISVDCPQDEETNRFIWRYVFGLVSHDNQLMHSELWRADFYSQLCAARSTLGAWGNVDRVIMELVEDLPLSTPAATPIFNTSDPTTFDTLLLNYAPRRHRMVLATHHHPLATIAQRYAAMQGLQQHISATHPQDARFVLNANLHVDSTAEALRLHGSIYPLHTLYHIHEGQLPPLRTFSEVRIAIQSLLCRNAIIRQTTSLPNLQFNESFSNDDFNCLHQALIGGTIQPDLYHGRGLPVELIASLQAYVDTHTNYRLQFAEQPAQAQRS